MQGRFSVRWLLLLGLMCLAACTESKLPTGTDSWAGVCIDSDGDGFGLQCPKGPDCNDSDPDVHADCPRCTRPEEGCECDAEAEPVSCVIPSEVTQAGSLLCKSGTRYCRDGAWSACEGIVSREIPKPNPLLMRAAVDPNAPPVICDECNPDCYKVEDPLDAGTEADAGENITTGPGGSITLVKVEIDLTGDVIDAGHLNDRPCNPGVAPDPDCDGIPDAYDPYPDAGPFQSNLPAIFLDLPPGTKGVTSFDLDFRLNTADIYFYVDMTASMEGERDNLINDLTSGNFLPDEGAGIECADRDFDGTPDDGLKEDGIAGNIACLIRDSQLGAGWFRDIPFEGPYANGTKVAPNDFEMFENRQDITNNVGAVLTALSGFQTRGNHNVPEGSMQGLWSLATGQGIYAGWERPGIPTRRGCPAGTWGYPCFRDDAVPIVIHITDAPLQNGPSPTSPTMENYLENCPEVCVCTKYFLGIFCTQWSCMCDEFNRHPLNYDNAVVDDMHAGTESGFRSFTTSAEAFATAQTVGAIDNVLVSYAGDTGPMASDVNYATSGNCPSGTQAWNSSDQGGKDAVFRFTVTDPNKTLTISTRGSRFDTTLLIKKVTGSSAVACNDNISSSVSQSEITRKFDAGDYYAVVKGRSGGQRGWFQITFGDKNRQVTTSFQPKKWLGPTGDGVGGIRETLLDKGIRVISINSSNDAYLAQQTAVLSQSTGAVDLDGNPLNFIIDSNGSGMGSAVIDAVNLLAGNLSMDVSVELELSPDTPSPPFGFKVRAIDQPGDLCEAPIDSDGDAEGLPDTHVNCRPGAAPRFQVTFENPESPDHVPTNPADPNGGWNMQLMLIGDGTYVVDRIPVYIIPEDVVPNPKIKVYAPSGTYEQRLEATGCTDNEVPIWRSLEWNATLPTDTLLVWRVCGGDTDAELDSCMLRTAAEARSGDACSTDDNCDQGYCDGSGVCQFMKGSACTTDADCGVSGYCHANSCVWRQMPVDLLPAVTGNGQGKKKLRMQVELRSNSARDAAPTVQDWRIDYRCAGQE